MVTRLGPWRILYGFYLFIYFAEVLGGFERGHHGGFQGV
jgi:hypothetical protein